MSTSILGSSPLTRGKLACGLARRGRGRLIPAHAGKTPSSTTRGQRARAHPRSRGENAPPFPPLLRHGGSSPLTRGKRPASVYLEFMVGLIPAHAGKTSGSR